VRVRLAVQDGDAEDDGIRSRLQDGALAIELRLAVDVGGRRLSRSRVGSIARTAGEDVVGGDVYQEGVTGLRRPRERLSRADVELARAIGVVGTGIWLTVCGACEELLAG
jgi:hypothetical protein